MDLGEWLELTRKGVGQSKCVDCDDAAHTHCEHCNRLFCVDHSKAHAKATLTKSHTLVPIDVFLKTPPRAALPSTASAGGASASATPIPAASASAFADSKDIKSIVINANGSGSSNGSGSGSAATLSQPIPVASTATGGGGTGGLVLRLSDCPTHPTYPLDIYCTTCDQPICVRCSALAHKRCDGEDMRDAFVKQKTALTGLLSKVESKAAFLNHTQKQLVSVSAAVKSQHEAIEHKITAHFDQLIAKLHAKSSALLLQLHLLSSGKQKTIEHQMASLLAAERLITQGCSQTRSMLQAHENDVRVMWLKTQIVNNLNELAKLETVGLGVVGAGGAGNAPNGGVSPPPPPAHSLNGAEGAANGSGGSGSGSSGGGGLNSEVAADLSFSPDAKLLDIINVSTGGIVTSSTSIAANCYILDSKGAGSPGGGPVVGAAAAGAGAGALVDVKQAGGGNGNGGGGGGGAPQILTVVTGADVRWTIVSVDSKGMRRTSGGDKYSVEVRSTNGMGGAAAAGGGGGGDAKAISVAVVDNRDGTYTIIAQAGKSSLGAEYALYVSLRGVVIGTPPVPLVLRVVHALEYSNCEGRFVRKIGGPGLLYNPSGLAISPEGGHIYVADYSNHRIVVLNPDGKQVRTFGSAGSGTGQLQQPSSVTFGPHGNVYVAEYGGHRIQVFTPEGAFVHKWGTRGSSFGEFDSPWGVAYDRRDNLVWVAEYTNNRIQIFTADGQFVRAWNKTGSGNGELKGPTAIAFAPCDDLVYICEYSNNRVQCFRRDGTYVRQFSSVPTGAVAGAGAGAGAPGGASELPIPQASTKLSGPSSVAVDPDGYLYIADQSNHTVRVFDPSGAYVRSFGSKGSLDGCFNNPTGLALGEDTLYVADQLNNRICSFK